MVQDPRTLLTENLGVVKRAVAFACRRAHFQPDEAEEFASIANVKLIDNDYAILRAYAGRSSFSTYISIVVQRLALDYRTHEWGKWHASSEAKRLGALAVELEQLLHRDGRSLDDVVALLAARYEGVTRASLAALAERLPPRAPRHRDVPLDDADDAAAFTGPQSIEDRVEEEERRAAAAKVTALLAAEFDRMPDDDRLILQMRYEQGMSVAQIARALQRDQKLLYRQLERLMKEIRTSLLGSGVLPAAVAGLIGRDESYFSFDFGKDKPRPSKPGDEKEASQAEEDP